MSRFSLILVFAVFGLLVVPASAQVLQDSLKLDRRLSTHSFTDENDIRWCNVAVWATWPSVGVGWTGFSSGWRVLDENGGFVRWATYAQKGTPHGDDIVEAYNIEVADGDWVFVASYSVIGFAQPRNCAFAINRANEYLASQTLDWYVHFPILDGTPIALFKSEQRGAVDPPFISTRSAVTFDGSFESGLSRERESTGSKPVVAYAWDFGDGKTGSGGIIEHIYEDAGSYTVTLTVTDDDGDTADLSRIIHVSSVILAFELSEEMDDVGLGDTVSVSLKVRNDGAGVAKSAKIPRTFLFPYKPYTVTQEVTFGPPLLTSDTLALDIDPGDSVLVEQKYVVTRTAKGQVNSVLQDISVEMEPSVSGINAKDEADGEASIVDACLKLQCNNKFNVSPQSESVVNSVEDHRDDDLTDGVCSTGNTITLGDGSEVAECTLRAAIESANADASVSKIQFDIDGDGPHKLTPASALPPVLGRVYIDATSQPGYGAEPLIEIDGSGAGGGVDGLALMGAGSRASGLKIDGFSGSGVRVQAPNVVVTRMHIGTLLGNGLHGLLATGAFDNLSVGLENDPESGNMIGNSGGHGIYLKGPDDEALSKNAHVPQQLKVFHNLIGAVIDRTLANPDPTSAPNQLNGICLQNAFQSIIRRNTIVSNVLNGISLSGQQSVENLVDGNDIGGYFKRIGNAFEKLVPMGNGENGILVHAGASGNRFGPFNLGGRPNTIVANSHYGMRLQSSNLNTIVSSLFGVPSDSTDTVNNKREDININLFGNGLGGLCLEDSERNVIKQNVVSNNGSAETHAGIWLQGLASRANRVIGNIIGSNRLGGLLGNRGSGILLSDGANNNTIGGETEEDGNLVGGNTGNGLYLRGESTQASLAKSDDDVSLLSANRLMNNLIGGGFIGSERTPMSIPNGLNGMCIQNATQTLARKNAIISNVLNGIEVKGRQSVENLFQGNDIGGLFKRAGSAITNVFPAGNGMDGVRLDSLARRNAFRGLLGRQMIAIANGGYAFRMTNAHQNEISGSWIGLLGDTQTANGKQGGAEIINLGNALGGICVNNSANTLIGTIGNGNVISNNGTDSTNAGVTLLGPLTKATKLLANIIGTSAAGMTGVGNTGPAIAIEAGVTETEIGGETDGEANTIAGGKSGGILSYGTVLTKVLGNIFGRTPDRLTPLPNLGPSIRFFGSQRMTVIGNLMHSKRFPSMSVAQSSGGLFTDNTVFHDDPASMTPAIDISSTSNVFIGSGSISDFDNPANTIVAHEAVHVMQSSGVVIAGNRVEAPADIQGGPEQHAIEILSSGDVKIGQTTAGNILDLKGGKGIVVDQSSVSAKANHVTNADDAIVAIRSSIELALSRMTSNKTGIRILGQSNATLTNNIVEASTGTNSGIHFENSTGTVTGSSITMDAGDAIWLGGSTPIINNNNIVGSAGFGVFNNDATTIVNARDNWWGDDTGPAGEGPGNGDRVSANVDYAGWHGAAVGIVLSTDLDTVLVVPGDSVFIPVAVQNVLLPQDVADISMTDSRGWLSSATAFEIVTGFSPSSFVSKFSVPADANQANAVEISAQSQNETSLSDAIAVVMSPAVATATVTIAASQANVSLVHESAIIDVVSNTSQSANEVRLYYFENRLSDVAVSEERVTSANAAVVQAILVMNRSWAVQAKMNSANTDVSAPKQGAVGTTSYRYNACFSTTGFEAALGALDNALVLYRRYSIDRWSPLPTTRRTENGTEFLCASNVSDFGHFSLASAITATPSAPSLAYPTPDLEGVGSSSRFSWNRTDGTDSYEIEIATDTEFLMVAAASVDADTSFAAADLAVDTRHYWRVRSGGALGFGPWSPSRSFTTSSTGVAVEPVVELPQEVSLEANYPNPFSDRTNIVYRLPKPDHVRIDVFDLQGRLIRTLVDTQHPAGAFTIAFDAQGVASGVYFYRMRSSRAATSRSMVIIR